MAQAYIASTGPKVPILPLARISRPQNRSISPSSSDSTDTPTPPTRRTRTGRPKVKTGCITCKYVNLHQSIAHWNFLSDYVRIRRVKCDETKPECERCTTTGRKCDGYLAQPHKQAAAALTADVKELVVSRSINWEQGDLAERRAIDFFRCRTAPSVSSYFDTDFVSACESMKAAYRHCHMLTDNLARSGRLW